VSETSAPLPRGESEFIHSGLTTASCRLVSAPRVAESHAALECKVVEIVALKDRRGEPMGNYLVLGEVVAFHIDDRFIHDGVFDAAAARSLARCGYQDYAVSTSFTPWRARRAAVAANSRERSGRWRPGARQIRSARRRCGRSSISPSSATTPAPGDASTRRGSRGLARPPPGSA